MTSIDWLLIFLGVGVVVLFAVAGLMRALFTAIVLWAVTLLSAATYTDVAFRVQAIGGENLSLFRGIVFDTMVVVLLVVGYVLVHIAFPDTKLPKLGFLDNLLGMVIGVAIAVVLVSLLQNSMGAMVAERWVTNETGWASLRAQYLGSGLRPYTSSVVGAYGWLFALFFRGLPPVLFPQ
ncbi:MAG: hypothetical protein MUQ30_10170 [Anaerolineae bacterium]|nr:hypothetical protein [Anaerolineae bacterium]